LKKLIAQPTANNGFRIWTDSTGTKKLEAKLIGFQNNNAKLQLKTGQTGTMNIKSFSETDQKLIRQFQEQKNLTQS
jgi:hypothetical protein